MNKILIIPDVHLGIGTNYGKDPVGIGLNSRIEDQKDLLYFVLNYAEKNNIKSIMFTGDIWEDPSPKANVVEVFFKWIKEANNKNILVYIVVGNHDYLRSGNSTTTMLNPLKALELEQCIVVDELSTKYWNENVSFTFMPYVDRKELGAKTHSEAVNMLTEQLKNELDQIKAMGISRKILIGHMCLENAIYVGEIHDEKNEIMCPLKMFDGFDNVWMGHIHKHQIMQKTPHIAHIGSIDKTSFTGPDSLEKYFVCFDCDSGEFEYIELPCRNLIEVQIDIPEQCEYSTGFVLDELKNKKLEQSIVRLIINIPTHQTLSPDKEQIIDYIYKNKKAFHVSAYKEKRIVEKVLIKNAEIDETIDHLKSIDVFANTLNANDTFKSDFVILCKNIIKTISAEEENK